MNTIDTWKIEGRPTAHGIISLPHVSPHEIIVAAESFEAACLLGEEVIISLARHQGNGADGAQLKSCIRQGAVYLPESPAEETAQPEAESERTPQSGSEYCTAAYPGRKGEILCVLEAGHDGLHRADDGAEWEGGGLWFLSGRAKALIQSDAVPRYTVTNLPGTGRGYAVRGFASGPVPVGTLKSADRIVAELEEWRLTALSAMQSNTYDYDELFRVIEDARHEAESRRLDYVTTTRYIVLAVLRGGIGYCDVPPAGWRCTRARGHDGPCAAVPTK